MRRFFRLFLPPMLLLAGGAMGAETVGVCFNYGCLSQAEVTYSETQLMRVRALLAGARSADEERRRLSPAIGWLLGWAGEQSPIGADRGGNVADQGVFGRMDCIDHSTTTTRLLRLLEARGWLRFHRVVEPALRIRYLFAAHYSARIEEIASPETARGGEGPAFYVVDSWFRDNGQPAVVTDLQSWLDGAGDDEAVATVAGAPERDASDSGR